MGPNCLGKTFLPVPAPDSRMSSPSTNGDTVDFAIGRGLDGSQYGSGLGISSFTFAGHRIAMVPIDAGQRHFRLKQR